MGFLLSTATSTATSFTLSRPIQFRLRCPEKIGKKERLSPLASRHAVAFPPRTSPQSFQWQPRTYKTSHRANVRLQSLLFNSEFLFNIVNTDSTTNTRPPLAKSTKKGQVKDPLFQPANLPTFHKEHHDSTATGQR